MTSKLFYRLLNTVGIVVTLIMIVLVVSIVGENFVSGLLGLGIIALVSWIGTKIEDLYNHYNYLKLVEENLKKGK